MADLARRAQVDANTFSEWKTKGKHPSPNTLKAVADALGTTERRLWDAYEGTAEAGSGVTDAPDLAAAIIRQAEAMESLAKIQAQQTAVLKSLMDRVDHLAEVQGGQTEALKGMPGELGRAIADGFSEALRLAMSPGEDPQRSLPEGTDSNPAKR